MNKVYKKYKVNEITKEVLSEIAVGDLIKINGWKKPLKVKGVSENFFVMSTNQFGSVIYSICEKRTRECGDYNSMRRGYFHCGTDDMIFGWISKNNQTNELGYQFDNIDWVSEYLEALEKGNVNISDRRGVAIECISVKKGK